MKSAAPPRKFKSDQAVPAGLALAICALVFSGAVSQTSVKEIQVATAKRARARIAEYEITSMNLLLQEAESGQRGFLLTGDPKYLKPYDHAVDEIGAQAKKLARILSNSPIQLAHLDDLDAAIGRKLQELSKTVELQKAGKTAEAIKLVRTHSGLKAMIDIRLITEQMATEQNKTVQNYNAEVAAIQDRSWLAVMIGSVLAVLIASASVIFLIRNNRRRAEAELELIESNDELARIIFAQRAVATADLDEKSLMTQVVEHANDLTGAQGAVIEIVENDEMVYHFAVADAARFVGLRIKREGSFSGLAVREGKTLLCRDTDTDLRVNREACLKVNVRSMIVSPLFHDGKVVAVLKVFSPKPNQFTDREVSTLELIGGILAAAIGRARTQAQLIVARDTAESATRTKSQFLANMSHEIRTPLNGILGMSRLLLDTPLQAEQKEFAENIFDAGDALLKLVNDILDFSKIEAGKLEFEAVNFDLNSTLQDLCKSFKFACSQKNLDFSVHIDPNLPPYLIGDAGRLRQILINLVGNSVKFTSSGHIKLRISVAGQLTEKVNVRFEIEDSGIGISDENLKSLFTEFVQADLSTTRRYGGTGLGLSICKRMVEMMSGSIGAHSRLGEGTTFWFNVELPRGHKSDTAVDHEAAPTLDTRGRDWRVLVVDDNKLNQMIAVKSLTKLGVKSEVAENGRLALDLLREKYFDVVLMDCQMPEMDGYEATAMIRKGGLKVAVRCPVIAMTANAMKEEEQRCLAAGMDDYLSKPFTLQRLTLLLQKWFDTVEARERKSLNPAD